MAEPLGGYAIATGTLGAIAAERGMDRDPVAALQAMFQAAIAAAQPEQSLPRYLPLPPPGKTKVVGAGKAAAAMARVVEQAWPGELSGVVVTRYGHRVPTAYIEVLEAGHPVPDEAGRAAAGRLLATVNSLGAQDLVLCLLSGGGSALTTLPPPGITLRDLADLTQQLLRSGADIREINTLRKVFSQISGGRLAAAAYPAQVVSLIISDVPGDDLRAIASGPTVGDTVTTAQAIALVEKYGLSLSPAMQAYLQNPTYPVIPPDDRRLSTTTHHLIATPQAALAAAATVAERCGYRPLILGSALAGEARQLATVMAGIVQQVVRYGQPIAPPCVVLSGGETTVTLDTGTGRGGRNTEFLLALAIALEGQPGVWAIAGDTDGIDGTEDNAGAILTPQTLADAATLGLSAPTALAQHDSYGFFNAIRGLVFTGPTLTNVNDFRAIVIEPQGTA